MWSTKKQVPIHTGSEGGISGSALTPRTGHVFTSTDIHYKDSVSGGQAREPSPVPQEDSQSFETNQARGFPCKDYLSKIDSADQNNYKNNIIKLKITHLEPNIQIHYYLLV